MSELLITKCVSQKKMHDAGSPVASRNFLANSFGLLDSIWMRAVSLLDRTCRSRLSAPDLGVLGTPDRPPLFVWSLAGEVGRAVLSRTSSYFWGGRVCSKPVKERRYEERRALLCLWTQ